MKKILLLFYFMWGVILSGCMIGPGMNDLDINLIDDYFLIKNNRNTIFIGKENEVGWEEVIPPKVIRLFHDNRYIIVEVQLIESDSLDFSYNKDSLQYFIIDSLEDTVQEISSVDAVDNVNLEDVNNFF